jgi:hypothetical protein
MAVIVKQKSAAGVPVLIFGLNVVEMSDKIYLSQTHRKLF